MDTIGVMNEAAEEPRAQIGQLDSDQDIELLLLARHPLKVRHP